MSFNPEEEHRFHYMQLEDANRDSPAIAVGIQGQAPEGKIGPALIFKIGCPDGESCAAQWYIDTTAWR